MTLVNSRRAIIRCCCAYLAGIFMLSAIVAGLLLAVEAAPPDAVIVAPREFVAALAPLAEHRQRQGHRLVHVPSGGSPAEIRTAIGKVAAGGALKYVLIVGDAEPVAREGSSLRRPQGADAPRSPMCVPAALVPAAVNVKWGSEPQIASDNWYA